MSSVQNYFKRVPKNKIQNNVYARSLKRKFSALNAEESKCEKCKKPNSAKKPSPPTEYADEHDCILVSTDENLLPGKSSESIEELNSLRCNETNLQRQIHEKVSSTIFERLIV